MLLAEKFRPRYDARVVPCFAVASLRDSPCGSLSVCFASRNQLLAYQVNMLRNRIDDSKISTTPEERAELTRLGELIDHDISDVMLVVQPATYHRWRKPKEAKRRRTGRPRTPQATVNLVLQFATEIWAFRPPI